MQQAEPGAAAPADVAHALELEVRRPVWCLRPIASDACAADRLTVGKQIRSHSPEIAFSP